MEIAGKEIALALFVVVPVLILGISFPLAMRRMEGESFLKRHLTKIQDTPLISIGSIALAVIFVLSSVPKLITLESVTMSFQEWGYPSWFMYAIGAIEFVAGVALLSTAAAPIAATVLCGVMLGAVLTHLWSGAFGLATIPALLFFALAYIAMVRALQKRGMFEDMSLPA